MRMPVRKILPAAQTQARLVSDVRTSDTPTSHAGGEGCTSIRRNIRNGVAGGKSDRPTDAGLFGLFRMIVQQKAGSIDRLITGIISDWASFNSLHAAPTAM